MGSIGWCRNRSRPGSGLAREPQRCGHPDVQRARESPVLVAGLCKPQVRVSGEDIDGGTGQIEDSLVRITWPRRRLHRPEKGFDARHRGIQHACLNRSLSVPDGRRPLARSEASADLIAATARRPGRRIDFRVRGRRAIVNWTTRRRILTVGKRLHPRRDAVGARECKRDIAAGDAPRCRAAARRFISAG